MRTWLFYCGKMCAVSEDTWPEYFWVTLFEYIQCHASLKRDFCEGELLSLYRIGDSARDTGTVLGFGWAIWMAGWKLEEPRWPSSHVLWLHRQLKLLKYQSIESLQYHCHYHSCMICNLYDVNILMTYIYTSYEDLPLWKWCQAGTGEGVDCNIRLVSPGCDEGLQQLEKIWRYFSFLLWKQVRVPST